MTADRRHQRRLDVSFFWWPSSAKISQQRDSITFIHYAISNTRRSKITMLLRCIAWRSFFEPILLQQNIKIIYCELILRLDFARIIISSLFSSSFHIWTFNVFNRISFFPRAPSKRLPSLLHLLLVRSSYWPNLQRSRAIDYFPPLNTQS